MPWPQNAYVGQKVIRVSGTPLPGEGNPPLNIVCEISRVFIGFWSKELLIDLKEFPAVTNIPLTDPGYLTHNFRPVQSTSRGMETLRALLKPKNHRLRLDQFDKEPQLFVHNRDKVDW